MVFIFFQIHNEIMFHFVLFLVEFSKVAIFCSAKLFFVVEKTHLRIASSDFFTIQ